VIRLLHILAEAEKDGIDISDLQFVDDEIKKDLENIPKNEIIGLGTAALVLAVPGILNTFSKIVAAIAKKNGIDLTKKKNPTWYQTLEKVTSKIDDYLDTPLRVILKPFIRNDAKREKAAKLLKATLLTVMAISGSLDVTQIKNTTALIKQLAPDIANEFITSITQNNLPKVTQVLKTAFT
jgi:hypothetical protein